MAKKSTEIQLPELAYLKLIKEESINEKELPADIKGKINGIKMALGRFKASSTETTKTSVVKLDVEIAEMIQNWLEEELPEESAITVQDKDHIDKENKDKEAEEERKRKETQDKKDAALTSENKDQTALQDKAAKIEGELSAIFESGKNTLTLEELKKFAPVSYKDIFDNYTAGEENGIETSRFALLEKEKETFQLTKK